MTIHKNRKPLIVLIENGNEKTKNVLNELNKVATDDTIRDNVTFAHLLR